MKTGIIALAVVAAIVFTSCGNNQNNTQSQTDMKTQNAIFPKGEVITGLNAANFNGTASLQMIMTNAEAFDCTVGNVTFEPGCRNSWHSHPGGQLLLVLSGEGYYQEKGKPIQLIKPGDVVEILPNVVHWHGATPDSPMEHLAIGTRSHMGPAVWGEPVTDEDYYSYR